MPRLLREKQKRVSKLTKSRWSAWYLALVPEPKNRLKINRKYYEQRKQGHRGFVYTEIKRRFLGRRYDNGIYEIRASRRQSPRPRRQSQKTKEDYVVYIGKTEEKGSNSLNERIKQYYTNGSHEAEAINEALKNGYKLFFRAKNIRDEDAKECEKRYLDKYDYAWNDIHNGRKRKNIPPP